MKKLAVVGATGLVGQTVMKVLNEEKLDERFEIFLFVSERSEGKVLVIKDKHYPLIKLDDRVLENMFDYAIFLTDESISRVWAAKFTKKGTTVIDNSSAFRLDTNVPLIVPEINIAKVLKGDKLIANPNCSTIQLVIILDRLKNISKFKKVIVSSYQSVSGAGRSALEDLENHTCKVFEHGINDNIIPQIGSIINNGNCSEEEKIILESKKILEYDFDIYATTVRVPISFCHGESVYVEFEEDIDLSKICDVLVCDYIKLSEDLFYPSECVGSNLTYVYRLRKTGKNIIQFFVLADNLRRGAAYNAVKILGTISKQGL